MNSYLIKIEIIVFAETIKQAETIATAALLGLKLKEVFFNFLITEIIKM